MNDKKSSENNKSITLRVQKAKKRDLGKSIIRLDDSVMDQLDVQTGDVISIKGKEESTGIAWPAYPQDNELGIVRFDSRLRKNTGAAIDDTVEIKKVEVHTAQNVILAPSNVDIRTINTRFESFVKRKLSKYPVTINDIIIVSIGISREITFKVINLKPKGVCIIKQDTILHISDRIIEDDGLSVPSITYKDIGGLKKEIGMVQELVETPLNHPSLFKRLGTKPPRGILLVGPPGTGKTLLAKAIANESEAHFISINGPEIISKFHGESEKKLRKIFIEAEEKSPSIIFIDHLDSLFPKLPDKSTSAELLRSISTQLIALMDGIHERGNFIVIGATNDPKVLDPSIKRPGRFDRIINLNIPNEKARLEIFKIHVKSMPLSSDIKLHTYAKMTEGFSGAIISAICKEAALSAIKTTPELNLETEQIDPEQLAKIEVKDIDFQSAIKRFTTNGFKD